MSRTSCSTSDEALLSAFADARDQNAFRALVDRHIDLVYAAARRQVRDPHLAEDVSQAVFALLARKAHRIPRNAALAGWLISATRYVARDAMKSAARRARREKEAASSMNTTDTETPEKWREIGDLLDDALSRLRSEDRDAITLRYLKGMSLEEVGRNLGVTTPAAQKRVERALAKLRDSFSRRGVVLSVDAIATALAWHSSVRAPRGLAANVATAAMHPIHTSLLHRLTQLPAAGISIAIAILCATMVFTAVAVHSASHLPARNTASRGIKVGVILSEFTYASTHPSSGAPYDLTHQSILERISRLRNRGVDVYIIIEPGQQLFFKSTISHYADPDHVIVGTDLGKLKSLDVIVAGHSWHMLPSVLKAVHQAVEGGVGFLEQSGFAVLTPGFTPAVNDLSGMESETYFYSTKFACPVLRAHPILGTLKPSDHLDVSAPCGTMGELHGQPLLAAYGLRNNAVDTENGMLVEVSRRLGRPATTMPSANSESDGPVFYPLYIAQLGKGKIIACQWHNAPPPQLDGKNDGTFYLRCIQWLAGRDVK